MKSSPSILAFSGSTRKESYNHKLVEIAALGARALGINVHVIRLSDYPMPLYDGDLEEQSGVPDKAKALKQLMFASQGLLVASPEYNSSISGVLKNTIDWLSRREEEEVPLQCFKGKVISLMSASPGALGGLRGLVHVRAIFGNIGAIVLPDQVAVPSVHQAFDPANRLRENALQNRVEALGANVAEMLIKLNVTGES